jgi:hypothetical protein
MLVEPAVACHCRNVRVTRRKEQDIPLAEYPGWAVDVMMGLYGERQVTQAIAAEAPAPAPTEPLVAADLDAVESFLARVSAWGRGLRRR